MSLGGRRRALVAFAGTALTFGTAFAGIKAGLAAVPPALFAGVRFVGGGLLLLGVWGALGRLDRPRGRGDWWGVLAAGAFLVWLNGVTLFVGQRTVTSAAAATLFAALPVLTPLFARVVLGERLGARRTAGLAVGFAGTLVVVAPDPGALASVSPGRALVGVAVVSAALGGVLLRRAAPAMDSVSLTGWAMLLGGCGALATSRALGESWTVTWTPGAAVAVGYVVAVATAVSFPTYFWLIGTVGPTRANLTSYVVPLVAAVAGAVAFGETVAPTTAAGFLVIAVGFLVMEWETVREAFGRGDPSADEGAGSGAPPPGGGGAPADGVDDVGRER
ncbi:DMT family transporter [Candidatus Halobonum tyrrellensis]|uniref:EamA domain-containing protein n=1 Tax=Candidatus Halobonum tyrrellensis G22 TaxID=1324957 RepID=V4GSU5_9EURY|nr:DMT family transporter [Candidatus Halobonum tyrrellensis]ESP88171.1 hypothetical protein K933_10185 [Candidatus Halobonum tyrrellensis G22]